MTDEPDEGSRSPFVSVIVLSFNGEKFIGKCIQSLIRADYRSFEVIVVDNGSTDRSAEIVKKCFPSVGLVLNRENLGFAGGNNRGIRIARGDLIVLLNQDTEVEEDWLTELVKVMWSDSRIGVAGCKILYPDRKTIQHAGAIVQKNALTSHYGYGETDLGQYNDVRDVDYVTGAAIAIKRVLIDELGLLDEGYFPAYFEETDYCFRARRAGYRVIYVPSAVVYHHESVGLKRFSRRFYYHYHRNRIRFVLKNYSLKDFALKFVLSEVHWLRRYTPKEQIEPLVRAYLANVISIGDTVASRARQGH